MATKGKISELYNVEEIQAQQNKVLALIDEYVRKVNEGSAAKLSLSTATKPSEIVAGLNTVITAQKEQTKTAYDAVTANNALGKSMQANVSTINELIAARTRLQNTIQSQLASQKEDLQLLRDGTITREEYIKRINESNVAIEKTKARLADVNRDVKELTKTERQRSEQLAKNARIEREANEKQVAILQKSIEKVKQQKTAYAQLEAQYKAAAARASEYNLTLGANHPITQRATATAKEFSDKLKDVDASVGKTGRNVGNYASDIVKGTQRIWGAVRTIAYILPGIGIAGIFGAAGDAIVWVIDKLAGASEATKRLKAEQEAYNKTVAETRSQVAQEVAKVEVLIEKIKQETTSKAERITAVKELQQIAPEYFGILNAEKATVEEITGAYKKFTAGIQASIEARVLSKQLEELVTQRLALEKFVKPDQFVEVFINGKMQKVRNYVYETDQQHKKNQEEYNNLKAKEEAIAKRIASLQPPDVKGQNQKDPKAPKGPSGIDPNDLIFKLAQERRKILFEIEKKRIEDEMFTNEQIMNNEQESFVHRKDAIARYYQLINELRVKQKEFDLNEADEQEKEEIRNAQKDIKNKQKEAEAVAAIRQKYSDKRQLIEASSNSESLKNQQNYFSKQADLSEKTIAKFKKNKEQSDKEIEQNRKSFHELEMQDIQNRYDEELLALDKKFAKGRIKEEQYNKKRMKLQLGLQLELLEADIKFTKETLELAEARALASGKQEDIDAVRAAKAKLLSLEIQFQKALQAFQKESGDQTVKNFEKTATRIKDIAKEVLDIIGSFVKASTTRQLNAVQDQIDALEEKKQKDIEVVNASITSAQDKAAQIAIIEARAAAQKEQLERRQRKIQEENARFEKAATIAALIMETALAVVRALGSKPYTPANIGLAIATGALGAAQIAAAVAQPIPRYEKGGRHGQTGPAIVGEKRAELLDIPGKGMFVVKEPTLFHDLPGGTEIHPDANALLLNEQFKTTLGLMGMVHHQQSSNDQSLVVMGLKDIERAVKKIPQTQIIVANPLSKRVRFGDSSNTYLNRNLQ